MSFKQYRLIDLFLFLLMYAICEYLVIKAATVWFDEPYTISIMLPLLMIVMMRWDKYTIIHAVIYALLFVYYQNGNMAQYLIYLVGNLGFMLTIFYVNKIGKNKIKSSFLASTIYLLISYVMMELFRSIASIIFMKSDIRIILQFLMSDMLSLVFAMLVIIVVKKQDGLFEDQKQYLYRLDIEKKKTDGGWQDE